MSQEEITFRIITLGDSAVGKTSLIKRFVKDEFDELNMSTIGLDFCFKTIIINENKEIKLKLVDTSGQEKYRSLAKAYFKNADGVLFLFALNNKSSFQNISNWMKSFIENCENDGEKIPKLLIGSKCDLESTITDDEINKFTNEHNIKFKKVSSKENIGIEEAFLEIGEILYENHKKNKNKPSQQSMKIEEIKDQKKKKKECLFCKSDL